MNTTELRLSVDAQVARAIYSEKETVWEYISKRMENIKTEDAKAIGSKLHETARSKRFHEFLQVKDETSNRLLDIKDVKIDGVDFTFGRNLRSLQEAKSNPNNRESSSTGSGNTETERNQLELLEKEKEIKLLRERLGATEDELIELRLKRVNIENEEDRKPPLKPENENIDFDP